MRTRLLDVNVHTIDVDFPELYLNDGDDELGDDEDDSEELDEVSDLCQGTFDEAEVFRKFLEGMTQLLGTSPALKVRWFADDKVVRYALTAFGITFVGEEAPFTMFR